MNILRAGFVVGSLLIVIVVIGVQQGNRRPDGIVPSVRDNRIMPRNSMRRLRAH